MNRQQILFDALSSRWRNPNTRLNPIWNLVSLYPEAAQRVIDVAASNDVIGQSPATFDQLNANYWLLEVIADIHSLEGQNAECRALVELVVGEPYRTI